MLIEFSSDFDNLDSSKWEQLFSEPEWLDTLNDIAVSFLQGRHVITGSRKTLANIVEKLNQGAQSSVAGAFKIIKQKCQDIQTIKSQLPAYISIIPTPEGLETIRQRRRETFIEYRIWYKDIHK